MSTDGQRTLWRKNIAENFNRLSRANERYRRQTTDDRQTTMTYSEHELEFTFAKNRDKPSLQRPGKSEPLTLPLNLQGASISHTGRL